MPINRSIIPKSTPLVSAGGGFGAVGGWGRAFGETLMYSTIIGDVNRPRVSSFSKPLRISVVKDKPRASK